MIYQNKQMKSINTGFIFLLFITIFSCNLKKDNVDSISIDDQNKNEVINEVITTSEEENNLLINLDTINYNLNYFPVDSLLNVRILPLSTFHPEEIDSSYLNKSWLSLYKEGTTYTLSKAKVQFKRVNDPFVDNQNENTGWEIISNTNSSTILLIEQLPYLNEKEVIDIKIPSKIYPGDTTEFKYLDKPYKIWAKGNQAKMFRNSEEKHIWNYELYISTKIGDRFINNLLVSVPSFDDAMIEILFAGDIDDDGILDLIIETSSHYNSMSPTLYLSKPSPKEKIVIPVGIHTSTGC